MPRPLPILSVLASSFLTPLFPAAAQSDSAASTPAANGEIEELVITGTLSERIGATKTNAPLRTVPQSITVIGADQIARRNFESVSDAFRYAPGVKGDVSGNDSRVNFLRFRGFNDNGNAVFQDGLQLKSSGFGQFMPELYGMDRVEVLRGPSSALFGLGNPGGLVNLVSKRPSDRRMGEVIVEGGSFDQIETRFDLGGPIPGVGDRVTYRLTGVARDSGTQVDFVDDDRLYLAPAMSVRLGGRTTLTLLGTVQRDDTGSTNQFLPAEGTIQANPNGKIGADLFTGNPDFDDFDRTVYMIGYELTHQFAGDWQIAQTARYADLSVDSEQAFGGGLQADQRTLTRFAFTADAETDGITVDTRLTGTVQSGRVEHNLLFGVDYQDYDLGETQGFGLAPSLDLFAPDYTGGIPDTATFLDTVTTQRQIGVYAQDRLSLADRLSLTLNLRHDWVDTDVDDVLAGTDQSQDDARLTGRAGLVYLSDVGLHPYVSYARSFLPTTGTNAAGDAFEPTEGEQVEAGLRFEPKGGGTLLTVSLFNLVRENVRTSDPANPQNQIQTGEVRSRGVEATAAVRVNEAFTARGDYTFQDVEKTESNNGDQGKRPRQVPRHEVAAWVDYAVPRGPLDGLSIGLGARYKSATFADTLNTLEVPGFFLMDAAITYDWRQFRLQLNAENLLDNTHIASCTSANACFFGPEQRFTASIGYRW